MSLAGATHDRKGEASSPKTSRAGLRSKLQEMKASLSNQSHMESKEVSPAAPVSVIAVTAILYVELKPSHGRLDEMDGFCQHPEPCEGRGGWCSFPVNFLCAV